VREGLNEKEKRQELEQGEKAVGRNSRESKNFVDK